MHFYEQASSNNGGSSKRAFANMKIESNILEQFSKKLLSLANLMSTIVCSHVAHAS